ncbi:MAG: cell division protein FtsQ/DivIB [Chloroflexota bacterium]
MISRQTSSRAVVTIPVSPRHSISAQSDNRTSSGYATAKRHQAGLLIGRALALLGLMASSGLLYHVAFSPRFHLRNVQTSGNTLLSASVVEAAVAETNSEAFWLRSSALRSRLLEIPAVAEAEIRVILPDRVEVRVRERAPYGVLQTGALAQLMDADGVIIGTVSQAPPLLTIRNLDTAVEPPARIEPEAFGAIKVLSKHLGATAFEPTSFAYSQQSGLEFETREGITVRLGNGKDLEWKLGALDKMRQYLVDNRLRAQLIDVRFRDRPYFR